MIENHLYSLVTVVKYKLLPCLLAIFLTGCDRTEVTLSFTPEMASFSNEFDFDPLRGPVKDFTQTLMDEQGEVTKRVSGTLSEEGCFDSLELLDLENNTVLNLYKLYLIVDKENEKAIHIYRKLGFSVEGELMHEFFINGQYRNAIRMCIFQHQYLAEHKTPGQTLLKPTAQ